MGKKDEDVIYVEGCLDWMMTMGDCMSLLLTFFVLLLTFSTPEESRLMDVIGGIQGALSITPPRTPTSSVSMFKESEQDPDSEGGKVTDGAKDEIAVDKQRAVPVDLRSLSVLNKYDTFREKILELGFKNIVSTIQLAEGIMVKVPVNALFRPQSDKRVPRARPLIEGFANLIISTIGKPNRNKGLESKIGNEVRITCCFHQIKHKKSRTRFSTEWSLARKRAEVLGQIFIKEYNVKIFRVSYSMKVIPEDEEERMEFMLVEKLGTSKVSLTDLFNGTALRYSKRKK